MDDDEFGLLNDKMPISSPKYRFGCKNDGGDVILCAKMTAEMSFCVVISDEYDIIAACF